MIKPLFRYSIDIKSHSLYQDVLKKRPKHTRQFKFSMTRFQLETSQGRMKLLKTLKILKPIRKVDLRGCKVTDYDFWEPQILLSAFKQISHIKTLCVIGSRGDLESTHFKYFPQLKNLLYELETYHSLFSEKSRLCIPDKSLKSLKYCPKICSVNFENLSSYSGDFGIRFNRYLRSLESFVFRNEGFNGDQFPFPISACKKLKSVALKFPSLDSLSSLPKTLDELSNLLSLQEIELGYLRDPKLNLSEALKKIAAKGMLKKVKLEFGREMVNLYKFLEALYACKLTYFFITAFIEEGLLNSIVHFVQNMSHLESLELHILSRDLFTKDDNFIEICKQVSKLQALRKLALDFQTSVEAQISSRIPNFIPYLSDLFIKPIKLETFDIECDQLDPSEALKSLISLLPDSAASLTHLKIDFGDLSCSKKTYKSLRKLIEHLPNIQVLEIPCLVANASTSKILKEIAEAIRGSKYLRVFELGRIQKTVSLLVFKETVEAVASKRGLREFSCLLSCNFRKKLESEPGVGEPNMERIIEKNPHIEVLTFKEMYSCYTLYPHT